MGASRKLQGEIDRVLKKVQEGVDVFDSIWKKVYDTENANQKEKFEADLKKEIKKLQRYRDQIKTWIQSSEIKDKKVSASYEQALIDARKLIEREMERFKVCEKETKTKAFSKEGLGQQPKTDPREKAKSETRDWLNNMVSELESQIDYFEAEVEGLTMKRGKTKPPRLVHLEESIARHKAHIMKLELILRLLDNDELSPEEINDVKEFVEDYVERNQDDFEDFADVDDLYSTLPLDKVEGLEDLVAIVPPAVVVKEKPAIVAATGSSALNNNSLKPSTTAPPLPTHPLGTVIPQASGKEDTIDETTLHDSISDSRPQTPTLGATVSALPTTSVSSAISASIQNVGLASSVTGVSNNVRATGASALSGVGTIKVVTELNANSPSAASVVREDEVGGLPSRRVIPEVSPARSVSRSSGASGIVTGQSSSLASLSSSGPTHSGGAVSPDITKRVPLSVDDRTGSSSLAQQLRSPVSGQNKVFLQQGGKLPDGNDSNMSTEGSLMGARGINNSSIPGGQWRSQAGSSFQNQTDIGKFRIMRDQREQYLEDLQHLQQQGHSSPLLGTQLQHLSANNQKQFPSQQQSTLLQHQLLQQHHHQQGSVVQNSQSSTVQQQQIGHGLGLSAQSISSAGSISQQQQQVQSVGLDSGSQQVLVSALSLKDNDAKSMRLEDNQMQQQPQKLSDESIDDSATNSGYTRSFMNDDDLKNSYTFDVPVVGPGSLAELSQLSKDADLSPGQQVQSVQPIGRRSASDLGAIGDNLVGSGAHDHSHNLQMLDAAFYRLPHPKDHERAKTYEPKHPVATPPSYPQTPAPIFDNPAFWERVDPDTLFFAFYHQQNTYQQYLAARELKRQSWRYHRKYNTWFQRHAEPKVTNDDYEKGTYVYFDFNIQDDFQQGWCQRIKTEFTFEYSYLEDELVV